MMMNNYNKIYKCISLIIVFIYLSSFYVLYPIIGNTTMIYSIIPVLLIAWFYNFKYGIVLQFILIFHRFIAILILEIDISNLLILGVHLGTILNFGVLFFVYYLKNLIKKVKNAEEMLKKSHNLLEIRVVERTSQLQSEIKEHKKTEEALRDSEKRTKIILETEPECVKIIDLEGKLEYMNPAGLNMIDAENLDQVKGKSILPLITTEFRQLFADLTARTLIGEEGQLEFEAVGLKGRHIWLHTKSVPYRINKNEISGLIGVTRDVTLQKKAEQELMEREAELIELNATKDKFFSIIAHDLKSPFNSILGFSKILNENFENYDLEKKKYFLSILHKSIQNTFNLLENLLTWSRSQRGIIDFNPEKLNLKLIFNETIELLDQRAKNKSILLVDKIHEDIFVSADKNMLLTIIRNLISNAVKFTPKGGIIELNSTLKANEKNHKFVKIGVMDSGVGVSKEIQSKLFDIGESVSTKGTENESGTGLGLVLCKEFVEKHGGEIWVESDIGVGSEFYFTIPLYLGE